MGRERYYLQRDEAQSGRDIRESEERAQTSASGINKYSGIGRGLGTLLGIALGPATGGLSMALAGGLGSLGGSLAGQSYGKHKYGGPEKANIGLFNRDIAREQRKGIDQYWKGLKEQTAVNTLQDAITAGMYGATIKSGMADAASGLGFDKTAIRLGGTPKGMGIPTAPAPIQQANTAGLIPDYQQQQLGQYIDQIKQSNIARADKFGAATSAGYAGDAGAGLGKGLAGGGAGSGTGGGAGQGMNNWIQNLGRDGSFTEWIENLGKKPAELGSPVDIDPNLTGTAAVGATFNAGISTDANLLTGINAVPTSDTAISSVATDLNAIPSGLIEDINNLNFSGKSSLFSQQSVGSGNPNFLGDAVNNTDLGYDTKMRDRILDYMHPSKNWAPDHTIDMNMWDQIANAQNIQMPSILGGR